MRITHIAALVPYLDIEMYGLREVLYAVRCDLVGLENGVEIKTRTGRTLSVAFRRLNLFADNFTYSIVFLNFNKNLLQIFVIKNVRCCSHPSNPFLKNVCRILEVLSL